MDLLDSIKEMLVIGDSTKLLDIVKNALATGISADVILNDGLIKGMDIVGEKMGSGEMFIPEVLMSAKAMTYSIDFLKPQLAVGSQLGRGVIVIGTVKGDLHDIGKNLVAMMLESARFDVINLGVDVPPEKFVSAAEDKGAGIICMSALLTTTMPMMKTTIEFIAKSGLRNNVKILIGGASVTEKFASEIGADGYASDAGEAVKLVKQMLA